MFTNMLAGGNCLISNGLITFSSAETGDYGDDKEFVISYGESKHYFIVEATVIYIK